MSRSTFALYVGVFSIAAYMLMTFFQIIETFFVDLSVAVISSDNDTSSESMEVIEEATEEYHAEVIMNLLYYFIMFIASICLVYGVHKKRHGYMAPWVFLILIGFVFECVKYFILEEEDDEDSDSNIEFAGIFVTVVSALFWYPIYTYYKDLKHPKVVVPTVPTYVNAPEYSHANAKFVPTSVAVC